MCHVVFHMQYNTFVRFMYRDNITEQYRKVIQDVNMKYACCLPT